MDGLSEREQLHTPQCQARTSVLVDTSLTMQRLLLRKQQESSLALERGGVSRGELDLSPPPPAHVHGF